LGIEMAAAGKKGDGIVVMTKIYKNIIAKK
jgi:hypothetical protein